MSHLYKLSSMILMSLFAFAGVYLLKRTLIQLIPTEISHADFVRMMPHLILSGKFWLAILCYITTLAIYLFLLQGDEVGKIFSTTVGINVLLTTVGAVFFLGDTLSGTRVLGTIFIITGIVIINGSK